MSKDEILKNNQGKNQGVGIPARKAGLLGPGERPKDRMGTMKRIWDYLGRRRVSLAAVFFLILVVTLLSLLGPLLIGRGVDLMVKGPGQVDFMALGKIVLTLFIIYLAASFMQWLQIYFISGIAQETVGDMRNDLFSQMQVLPLRFFDSHSHGNLMSRFTNDVENVSTSLSQGLAQIFSSVLTILGTLTMMLYLSPLLTLVSLLTIPLGIFATGKIAAQTRKHFSQQQKELGALNGFIEETITGQRVVKAFGREEHVLTHFDQVNTQLKKVGLKAQILSGLVHPIMNVVNNMSFAIAAFGGGLLAVQGAITVGAIASFLSYSRQFARPINELANQFNIIQSALAGAERVFELMDEIPELADEKDARVLSGTAGEVDFHHVTFGYDKERPVLKNISIHAHPGQSIALVGPTGAGKTTIVNLLTRFYEIDQGEILIDGVDIRHIAKDSLRSALGIVLQDTYLFSDTVRENIRYGRLDASDQEVEKAAQIANAESFILRLPQGYDTILSGEGGRLSGGQKQLLTIARAVLADPSILILDEATSSVDTRTEVQIQRGMLTMMKGRTSFVIAHRLSTIRKVDLILVLKDGEIIERGSHEELLQSQGFYAQLYHSQAGKLPGIRSTSGQEKGSCRPCIE
ncbi:ABC transporter ATP-binding protein [Dehalobacterium formicoaceticum]|uniref:ABC transporter ATP-binding protein/permease n=1 Tax=Dehalobacterium formicoaceticum TaxID=51515 RepID=A0ABT1Y0M8_9FIRM|nr:ABC transporter ATP-binding protein [Dehalobacterium formicoaceticum]MCR6544422.1 ABC transporter ATP-binding protein/permease [Dehalobacterium formicoaceticum]